MSDWQSLSVGELSIRVTKGTTPTLSSGGFVGEGVAFVKVESITAEGDISSDKLARVSPETHSGQSRSILQANDLLFSIAGTIGRVAQVRAHHLPANTNQAIAIIRPDESKVLPQFLLYSLRDKNRIDDALSRVVQSVQANLSLAELSAIPIELPSLPEQQAIAEVLGALDDKIAANTRLAATAIELVMSRFARLLRQSRSETVPVESLVRRLVQPRKFAAPDFFACGDFPVYDQSAAGFLGYAQGSGSLEASAKNPILYFGDHTCILRLSIERFAVGPNTVPFVGSEIPSIVLFCALQGAQKHEEYKRHWQDLMTRYVEVPVRDAADDFAVQNTPTFELRDALSAENRTLAATRDALLPQLMSGKLRVRDAEKVVEAVV